MNAKEFLEGLNKSRKNVKSLQNMIRRLRESAEKCTTVISGMPRSPSPPESSMALAVDKIVELEQTLAEAIAACVLIQASVFTAISQVPDSDVQNVLILRYDKNMKWHDIAALLHYSERKVFALHGEGINAIQQILDAKTSTP